MKKKKGKEKDKRENSVHSCSVESPRMIERKEWPLQILTSDKDDIAAIAKISEIHNRLSQTVLNGYEHSSMNQHQVARHYLKLKTAIAGNQETMTISKIRLDCVLLETYRFGEPVRWFNTLFYAKIITIVQLLNGALQAVDTANFLVALICFRSIIEHVAQFHQTIRTIHIASTPATANEAHQISSDLIAHFHKSVLGTRIDWKGLTEQDIGHKLKGKNYEYQAQPQQADLKAKQIMTMIDSLEKAVPLVRGIYEVLCEFAHPNIGILYTITESESGWFDKQNVYWDKKRLGFGVPKLHCDVEKVFSAIFNKISECLIQFERDVQEAEQKGQSILELAKDSTRRTLNSYPDLIDPYSFCPCASGSKAKFCCGRKYK